MYCCRYCCNFAGISHSSHVTNSGITRKHNSYSLVSTTPRDFELYCDEVRLNHFPYQRLKCNLVMPPELGLRLCRITKQHVDFGRPEVPGVDLDKGAAVARYPDPKRSTLHQIGASPNIPVSLKRALEATRREGKKPRGQPRCGQTET